MPRPRKPRPSFDAPVVPAADTTPAPGWVYRTDEAAAPAEPATPAPQRALPPPALPASRSSQSPSVAAQVANLIWLPTAISLVIAMAPISWLTQRLRR